MEMYLIILHGCYTIGRNKAGHKTLGSCLILSIYGHAQCQIVLEIQQFYGCYIFFCILICISSPNKWSVMPSHAQKKGEKKSRKKEPVH